MLAGDVYAHPDHFGRGGWSWYTGAAGWYYQAAITGLLGLSVKEMTLTADPQLPSGWTGWKAHWDLGAAILHLTVKRGEAPKMYLDGEPVHQVRLLELRGEHTLEIVTA